VAETHVQSSETRIDGSTTLKRQKTRRPKTTRPRSADDGYRKSGRGNMDISGYKTDIEARQAIDEFWRPREHGLLRKKSTSFPRPQPPQPLSYDQSTPERGPRRHSDSSESPMTLGLFPSSAEPFILHPNKPLTAQSPRAPESLPPRDKPQASGITKKVGLEERLDNLFLNAGADRKATSFLTPSTAKDAQRAEQHKRREQEKARVA
jgi:hypothetical protein